MRMKIAVALIFINILLLPMSALEILDYSVDISKDFPDDNKTENLSLIVFALSLALNKSENLSVDEAWKRVEELLSWQNPDGGWGYFYGSVSSVPDTGYALIALAEAKKAFSFDKNKERKIVEAINRGISFLTESFTGDGWGYLKGMKPDYRSTLLASAALVFLETKLDLVEKAYSIIRDKMPSDPYHLYLWIIVTRKVTGETPSDALEKLATLNTALGAYAILSLKGLNFEAAKLLTKVEEEKEDWPDKYYPLYATMAFSLVSENLVSPQEDVLGKACSILQSLQNEDGGWGIYRGSPSSVSTTYFVLKAVKICNPSSDAAQRGLEFMRKVLFREEQLILRDRYMREEYLFALLSLLEYNALSLEEKQHAKELILSTYWGDSFGRQPLIVALAVEALWRLGVSKYDPIIHENVEWLLSMKNDGGWGYVFRTPITYWYFAPEYPETTIIFSSLLNVARLDDLHDTIEYILNNPPSQEWEKLYLYVLLSKLGFKPTWEIPKVEDFYESPLLDATFIMYYTLFPEVPKVNIYTVLTSIKGKKVKILTTSPSIAGVVSDGLKEIFHTNTSIRTTVLIKIPEYGNYILIYPLGRVDVSKYNADVKIGIMKGVLAVNGIPLYGDGVLLIVPGRNRDGELLFVLYKGRNTEDIANLLFNTPILKYLHGKAIVASWVDENRDDEVQENEISVIFI
ncbi:prenyltransferase/squalene oxidase repeat-containing protein [Pyrococcus sp. ST04]|uniref:prenyltransferase/squalene oxidase repeat-containing protein n=1 Tax=Pyrococcus sp. ST04 TaxID=1183377 RepID=UPI0002605B1C|nr:prenyltransferase/squalene oxidase repeat-containing protein [Pyrococcus sp. ST04]AFK22825.1 hypothetical protein Py04_1251 [Pyrococcus sp. ST04]